MKTKTIEIYTFDELTDKAKDKARQWYREASDGDEWWESVYEDAANIGLKIKSFELERGQLVCDVRGEFLDSARVTARKIVCDHGKDCDTFKAAQRFLADDTELRKQHFDAECDNALTYEGEQALEELEAEFLKDILADYGSNLQEEMEYQQSDEYIDESILANEYEFLANGERA